VFSDVYTRRVLAREFQIVCLWLLKNLVERGLWDDTLHNQSIAGNGKPSPFSHLFLAYLTLRLGSIQNIGEAPHDVKAMY